VGQKFYNHNDKYHDQPSSL